MWAFYIVLRSCYWSELSGSLLTTQALGVAVKDEIQNNASRLCLTPDRV
jgi:hypothetical protein